MWVKEAGSLEFPTYLLFFLAQEEVEEAQIGSNILPQLQRAVMVEESLCYLPRIWLFMVQSMRLVVTVKLCHQILETVVEEQVDRY